MKDTSEKLCSVSESKVMLAASEVTKMEDPGDVSSILNNSDQEPDVFRVTWMPDDHVIELTRILQGN